jgi:hypothetical protein
LVGKKYLDLALDGVGVGVLVGVGVGLVVNLFIYYI